MKKITIKDIAKESGVSTASVSHVINGTKNISESTRLKIEEVIAKYDYIPDSRATNLRSSKSKMIGLIVSSVPDQYVLGVINGITKQARAEGYHILFVNTDENEEYEEEALNHLISNRVDGIILTPVNMNSLLSVKSFINKIPTLQVLRYNNHLSTSKVTADDFSAGYTATKHLTEEGYRKIGIIYSRLDINPTINRIRGYKSALREASVESYEETLIGYATIEGGYLATKEFLSSSNPPDSLFILNDLMTLGAIKAIKEMNINCPEEIGVIGFGNFLAAELIEPSISVIDISTEEIGKIAVKELLAAINGEKDPKTLKIPIKLIKRKSTSRNSLTT